MSTSHGKPEKRRHARTRLLPPLYGRLELDQGRAYERLMIADLSESGCAVLLPAGAPPPQNARCAGRVEFVLPGSSGRIVLPIQCRGIAMHALGGSRLGIEFQNMETRLGADVQKRIREYLRSAHATFRGRDAAWRDKK
ncbi:MAG TPA: PilZ domain-containing protein [Planctomycetota bacterium]|nr:PilZ domain-containing protein [Planctomycetota bacterium]